MMNAEWRRATPALIQRSAFTIRHFLSSEPLAHALEEPAVQEFAGGDTLFEAHRELRHALAGRAPRAGEHERRALAHRNRNLLVGVQVAGLQHADPEELPGH